MFVFVILLNNCFVFKHFQWKTIHIFEKSGILTQIVFFDDFVCLLELVIDKKWEITLKQVIDSQVNDSIMIGLLIYFISLTLTWLSCCDFFDKVNKLSSEILCTFVLPRAFFVCKFYVSIDVFLFQKIKASFVFFTGIVVNGINQKIRSLLMFYYIVCLGIRLHVRYNYNK